MTRKIVLLIATFLLFLSQGCIKETYDLNRLSDDIKISPVFALPAATGDITIADIVEPSDTIRFESDNFIRIVFRRDSVFNFKIEDYYDFSDMVSFNRGYIFGEVQMGDFQCVMPITLDTLSSHFSPALRAQFLALDDGLPHDFPSFPETNIGEHSFNLLNGFENALISSGTLEISVRNNLTAPLDGIKIRLYNWAGHTPVGPEKTISSINPGTTKTEEINLAGISITNSIVAAITFTGSPGASNVIIDMDHTIEFVIYGYNLKIQSGRAIIPDQTLGSLDNTDTVNFDPGENIELEKVKITSGSLDYNAVSKSNLTASVFVSLPTTNRTGAPVSEVISVLPNETKTGSINFNNTEIDLNADQNQPYNRLPVNYEIKVGSGSNMVNFSKYDSICLILSMPDPEIDFMKGYFGQREEEIESDTINTELEEFLKKISGEFHISNPSIKVNYINSFGIPIGINLDAVGKRDNKTQKLNLAPFQVDYPVYPVRDISSTYIIDKTNSSLPDLVSLPPLEVNISGSGKMNPEGMVGGRDNYVYGNSRFLASLEIEVPMELWINNLQFADTADNFLKSDKQEQEDDDSPFKPENMEYFRLKITATNGFPLGASLKLILHDSITGKDIKTINATDIIKPAQVDASGKVTTPVETVTTIDFDKSFFEASKNADKMIFIFTLITSGGGTKDVKFYSDYLISFRATIVAKPNIIFN
ncbi:MAG: hypothetical protein ACUVTX_03615 [Bacteroidales bacterium]